MPPPQRPLHLLPCLAQTVKHAPSNVEGVFIAGNGFRSIGVIAALEEDLGRPVLTANQAAFWYALRVLAGVGAPVDDYGQVFKKQVARSE